MAHEDIYDKFCKWSPMHANTVEMWKPWGGTSICVWLSNGMKYKVKHHGGNVFTMQTITDEDIEKKYGKGE